MTTAPSWIARYPLIWVLPSGERRPGAIAIGTPEMAPGGESRCTYTLEGLEAGCPLLGADHFQALILAVRHVGTRLHDHFTHGVRVLGMEEPESDEERDPEVMTAELIRMLGPLVRSLDDVRGPADPKGEIAGLEAKLVEMRSPPTG